MTHNIKVIKIIVGIDNILKKVTKHKDSPSATIVSFSKYLSNVV